LKKENSYSEKPTFGTGSLVLRNFIGTRSLVFKREATARINFFNLYRLRSTFIIATFLIFVKKDKEIQEKSKKIK
jgi:hypothetical protein